MPPLTIAITVVALVWIVHRQFVGRFVAPGAAMVLPLVLIAVGIEQAVSAGLIWTALAVGWVAVDLLVTAGLGVVRGFAIRLTLRDGYLYQRGGVPTLVLWIVSIGVRVLIAVLAARTPAGPAVEATLLLSFGVSLVAQYAVLAARVRADGRPVRPSGDRRATANRSTLDR